MAKKFRLLVFTAIPLVLPQLMTSASAREQWQMQYPQGAPPTAPIGKGWTPDAGSAVPGATGMVPNTVNGASVGTVPGLVPGISGSGSAAGSGAMVPGLVPGNLTAPGGGMGQNHNVMHGQASVSPEFIQQFLATRVASGTVLTGVLSDDISSKKSKSGDLFSIILNDGYYVNGREVIPRGARIVGAVSVVAPAASKRGVGAPGHVDVGLSTLIFPDGRSLPFTGLIERNPAHDMKKQPALRSAGYSLADYGRSVGSMLGSFTSGIGAVRRNVNRGKDLLLEDGEMIAVRVTRSLDLTKMKEAPASYQAASGGPDGAASMGKAGAGTGGNRPGPGYNAPGAGLAPVSPVVPQALPQYMPQNMPQANPYLPKELPDPF